MYYTYLLQSKKDNTTYIGSTDDLRNRLVEHNAGKTKSIKHKLPVELVYYEAYQTKQQARSRELELKNNSWKKKELFERIFTAPSSSG
jgi:putative endonuclease